MDGLHLEVDSQGRAEIGKEHALGQTVDEARLAHSCVAGEDHLKKKTRRFRHFVPRGKDVWPLAFVNLSLRTDLVGAIGRAGGFEVADVDLLRPRLDGAGSGVGDLARERPFRLRLVRQLVLEHIA